MRRRSGRDAALSLAALAICSLDLMPFGVLVEGEPGAGGGYPGGRITRDWMLLLAPLILRGGVEICDGEFSSAVLSPASHGFFFFNAARLSTTWTLISPGIAACCNYDTIQEGRKRF